jgi:hypothetical protein
MALLLQPLDDIGPSRAFVPGAMNQDERRHASPSFADIGLHD